MKNKTKTTTTTKQHKRKYQKSYSSELIYERIMAVIRASYEDNEESYKAIRKAVLKVVDDIL